MDFNVLLAELRNAAQQYCKKISDKYAATIAYCEIACKTIDKLENIDSYENKVIGLWIILGYIGEMYGRLTPSPTTGALCQKLFRQCARIVLNIQWQQLDDESQSKKNFQSTLETFHEKLSAHNHTRFKLILDLIETGWTHPTLGLVMAEEDDNGQEECINYITKEDPVILKIRVEIMIQENCEEFALNLCSWCLKHPDLKADLDIRQTQLMLLHKLNQQDRLQEECQKIPCHDGVRLISRLQQADNNKSLCTELAQTFLIQEWIRPSDHRSCKDLLTLWIRHQYLADKDKEKFLNHVWAVAKVSHSTEQIGMLIDGVREECGDMLLQLYTDLCIFAINYDKSCLEQHMQEGDMEGLRSRQQAMASTCEKLSQLNSSCNTKIAMYAAVTAFALNPNQTTLAAVKSFYVNQSLSLVKDRGKNCCSNCSSQTGECEHATKDGHINPATFFEVERLLNMLRPYYLNPDHDWLSLGPACEKYLVEREMLSQNFSNEDNSANEGGIPELDQSRRTLLHQHLIKPVNAGMPGYAGQITQVSKHLKPFTATTTSAHSSKSQTQDPTTSIASIEPTLALADSELVDKHTLIKQLLFATEDLSLDPQTLNELLQQGNIDMMPEAFQEITIDQSGSAAGLGSDSQDTPVPVPGHMKHTTPISAADPLFTSLNIPEQDVTTTPNISGVPEVMPLNLKVSAKQDQQASFLGSPGQQAVRQALQQMIKSSAGLGNVGASQTAPTAIASSACQPISQSGKPVTNVPSSMQTQSGTSKSSVGSAVYHITSGLLRGPQQQTVVESSPTVQAQQTVVIENEPTLTSIPIPQYAVALPGGQIATQYYTGNFAQNVGQQGQVALNLVGNAQVSPGLQQISVPFQAPTSVTNLVPSTLSLHPCTASQIAPSIAAQLAQPQIQLSSIPTAQQVVSSANLQQSPVIQGRIETSKPQHLGKPQLAGLTASLAPKPKTDNRTVNPLVTSSLQQMLKNSSKTTYTSTNFPHVAVKSKTAVLPVVKKKSAVNSKPKTSTAVNTNIPTTDSSDPSQEMKASNVPFVLKSSLGKPRPKPKSKATIFTNSMMNNKVVSNTALLGGLGNESLTCIKPAFASGSTVKKPDILNLSSVSLPSEAALPMQSPNVPMSTDVTAQAVSVQTEISPRVDNPFMSTASSSNTDSSPVLENQSETPKLVSKRGFAVFYKCKLCSELKDSLDELRQHMLAVCLLGGSDAQGASTTPSDTNKPVKPGRPDPRLSIKALEACRVYKCPKCLQFCVNDAEVFEHRKKCLKSKYRPRKPKPKPSIVTSTGEIILPESINMESESSPLDNEHIESPVQESPLKESPTAAPSTCQVLAPLQLPTVLQSINNGTAQSVVMPSVQAAEISEAPQIETGVMAPVAVSEARTPEICVPQALELKGENGLEQSAQKLPPLDPSTLDLTNTEDLKRFIEHFKQQEMLKEKKQPSTSSKSKKSKKVAISKTVVSVMSSVMANVEAATAVPSTTSTAAATTQSLTDVTPSPVPNSSLASVDGTPKSTKVKPKTVKPKKLPNPKFREQVHNGNTFFKCYLCKQTFCRKDSMESHWPECYNLLGPIRKPKKPPQVEQSVSSSDSTSLSSFVHTTSSNSASSPTASTSLNGPLFSPSTVNSDESVHRANALSSLNPQNHPSKRSSPSKAVKPKPKPVPTDGSVLAKYDESILRVVNSSDNHIPGSTFTAVCSNPEFSAQQGLSNENNIVLPPGAVVEAPQAENGFVKEPTQSQGSIMIPNTTGQEAVDPEKKIKKKKKKIKQSDGSNEALASVSGANSEENKSKKHEGSDGQKDEATVKPGGSKPQPKKKRLGIPEDTVFENTGDSTRNDQSPQKRYKPKPKKKHVNVKQMLKDRLECMISGKKDNPDNEQGMLSPRWKGRPKPQILSETKQAIIIVGLEWGCGCAPCGTLFRNHRNLIQHLVIKHLKPYSTQKGEKGEPGITTCFYCQRNFPSFIAYLNHTPQHSESILTKLDELVDEQGDLAVGTSPEKEETEENYEPFPDIQEALNDMLKIRQQQTHEDEGMKIGTENETELPNSVSLESLQEFLPDPSKDNVDELAEFARMINDPTLNTEITRRISEEDSFQTSHGETITAEDAAGEHSKSVVGASGPAEPTAASSLDASSNTSAKPVPDDTTEVNIHLVSDDGTVHKASEDVSKKAQEQQSGLPQPEITISVPAVETTKEIQSMPEPVKSSDVNSQLEVLPQTVKPCVEAEPADQQVNDTELNKQSEAVPNAIFIEQCESKSTVIEESHEPSTPSESQGNLIDSTENKEVLGESIGSEPIEADATLKTVEDKNSSVVPDESLLDNETSNETLHTHVKSSERPQDHVISSENVKAHSQQYTNQNMTELSTETKQSCSNEVDEDVDENKSTQEVGVVTDDTQSKDGTTELKAIVKHLRSHPRKSEFIEDSSEVKGDSQMKRKSVFDAEDMLPDEKRCRSGSLDDPDNGERSSRKTPIITPAKQTGRKIKNSNMSEEEKMDIKTRQNNEGGKLDSSDTTPADQTYKLRKTIATKQFYKGSLRQKARMSKSSILDVKHSPCKLNASSVHGKSSPNCKIESDIKKEESKARIKQTAARTYGSRFATRSTVKQIEQQEKGGAPISAELPESPAKVSPPAVKTRSALRHSDIKLRSFEVRLDNMTPEAVRRKSFELANNSKSSSGTLIEKSASDEVKVTTPELKPTSPDSFNPSTKKANPTSPSFLDSFLSYLSSRSPDNVKRVVTRNSFKRRSSKDKLQIPEQLGSSSVKVPLSDIPLVQPEEKDKTSEVLHETGSVSDSVSMTPSEECDTETSKNSDIAKQELSEENTDAADEHIAANESQKGENIEGSDNPHQTEDLSEAEKTDDLKVSSEEVDSKEDEEKAQAEDLLMVNENNSGKTQDELNVDKKSFVGKEANYGSDAEMEEVIFVEEAAVKANCVTSSEEITQEAEVPGQEMKNESSQSLNIEESDGSPKPIETRTGSSSLEENKPDEQENHVGGIESKNKLEESSVEEVPKSSEVSDDIKDAENKEPDVISEIAGSSQDCSIPAVQSTEKVLETVQAKPSEKVEMQQSTEDAKTDDAKVISVETKLLSDSLVDRGESPEMEDRLKGVKSLREKVKTEPFTWDVDGEEDQKLAERNERSLKALRQQLSVAPFTWDLEEDDHGHVITGIEHVQIAPVASCSVTRTTRSGTRRVVKLSTDSQNSGGSTDSDKKDTSIECEATLTNVTWNVEVDDSALEDEVIADGTSEGGSIVGAPVMASAVKGVNSDRHLPGIVGRASVVDGKDGINCIRVSSVIPVLNTDTRGTKTKRQTVTISSGESSPSTGSVELAGSSSLPDSLDCCVSPSRDENSKSQDQVQIRTESKTVAKTKSPIGSKENMERVTTRSSLKIMTRKSAKAKGVNLEQPVAKRARTSSSANINHLPAMVRRSVSAKKFSAKYQPKNPSSHSVQIIRVDPVLEGVSTRRSRHNPCENNTVHTPIPIEQIRQLRRRSPDHKWTINRRKNFGYQFSRTRRDRKSR